MIEIVRIGEDFGRWTELLALILSSFAYMDGVIDPPSSADRLTAETLRQKGRDEIGFAAIHEGRLAGCVFLKPETGFLYIGKLAVGPEFQGEGIGRSLLATAERVAAELGLPALRLETRIELVANHATFAKWGFARSAENSHPGFTRVTSIEMQKRLA